jgi:carbon-monoxide dehydrogenase small subunit
MRLRVTDVVDERRLELTVNGSLVQYAGQLDPRTLLADFLRQELGLRGVHLGCEQGVCGACTIIVDGRPVKSCLMLAVQADGAEILTVEGLARDGQLHPLQQAFWDCSGLQCGYCTPGMLLSALSLLQRNTSPSEAEIRDAISGNLCRCTGYQTIVESVQQAAVALRASPEVS